MHILIGRNSFIKEYKVVKVLVLEPNKEAYAKEVPNELGEFQNIVGGYLEQIVFIAPNGVTFSFFRGKWFSFHFLHQGNI